MKTKYVTDIQEGDVFINVEINNTVLDDVIIMYVKKDNIMRLKQKKREAIPVAVTSYAGPDDDEVYEVYAESKNASLAYEPNGQKIDYASDMTHVSIERSPK